MSSIINQQEFQEYGGLEFYAKQTVEGFITGLHKSPYHGFSVEFAEHRLYNTGESTKHIDWKLFARTEKLFIKCFEEETNLRCQMVIDSSSSMHYPQHINSKFKFSIFSAACIMYLLKKQRDAVGLNIFSDKIETYIPAKSTGVHHKLLIHELEEAYKSSKESYNKKTATAEVLHQIADNIHKRSMVVIFSDMFDNASKSEELFSAMQHLRHNKHEVILFHVIDKKKELDFDFENRPYLFIDMETGEKVKAHANEVKQNYKKLIFEYKNELMLKCTQYKIDYIEANINQDIKQILLPYLIKRSKLY